MRKEVALFKKFFKIAAYIIFVIVAFIGSLLYMPFEYFLLTTIFVLVALRSVEKELGTFNVRSLKMADTQSKKTKE